MYIVIFKVLQNHPQKDDSHLNTFVITVATAVVIEMPLTGNSFRPLIWKPRHLGGNLFLYFLSFRFMNFFRYLQHSESTHLKLLYTCFVLTSFFDYEQMGAKRNVKMGNIDLL